MSTLGDNIHEFINLMDDRGELVFSDRQAHRMERDGEHGVRLRRRAATSRPRTSNATCRKARSPAHRHEAHEYKNGASAQGQAMGVLAAKSRKTLLLTGTRSWPATATTRRRRSEPCRRG